MTFLKIFVCSVQNFITIVFCFNMIKKDKLNIERKIRYINMYVIVTDSQHVDNLFCYAP